MMVELWYKIFGKLFRRSKLSFVDWKIENKVFTKPFRSIEPWAKLKIGFHNKSKHNLELVNQIEDKKIQGLLGG